MESLSLLSPAFHRSEHSGPTGDSLRKDGRTTEQETGSQSAGTSVEETKCVREQNFRVY